jgi:hypothetical protein
MTYAIANHHGSHFQTEQTQWSVFDEHQEYCGHVFQISAWAVPAGIHAGFSLPNHIDLYITSEGQWAQTLEIAEHLLSSDPEPIDWYLEYYLIPDRNWCRCWR